MLGRWRAAVLSGVSTGALEQWGSADVGRLGRALERLPGGRREEEKITGDGWWPAGRGRRLPWGGECQPGFARSADEEKSSAGSLRVSSLSAGFGGLFHVGPPKFYR